MRWGLGPTDGSGVYCGWNIDDIRIIGKSVFDPVGVMGVNIDVGNSLRPVAAERLDRQHRIIEIAEPVREVGHPVMGAPCGRVDHATIAQKLSSVQADLSFRWCG